LSIFTLNSFISLFMVFLFQFGAYLDLLWFHLFFSVFSHILGFVVLELIECLLYILVDDV
jgi:hypothetical protein